jgi:2-aminoethylphosphonate dioxygenase
MTLNSCTALHSGSDSTVDNSQLNLADNLKQMRVDTLSYILFGKNEERFQPVGIGPHRITKTSLMPLDTAKSILDVSCGTGDNLALMFENGFASLKGIDIDPQMVQVAKTKVKAEILCTDVFGIANTSFYDLVFAQAFIDRFPKNKMKEVMTRLLAIAQQRFYFSTTIHETAAEGVEEKSECNEKRYHSRYTIQEIIDIAKDILASDSSLSFHYFCVNDPLGKVWINGIFERHDIKKIFAEDGVLLYKQFYTPEEIETHQKELENMKDKVAEPGTILRYDATQVFDRVENFLPYCSNELRARLTTARVMNIVSALLGEEAILLKDKLNYKLPGAKKFIAHQDVGAGWDKYGDRHLTFALGMDEATAQNGALFFALGEHKNGLLSPMHTPLGEEVVKRLQWSIIPTKPGDALFFDSYTPHYSGENKSQIARKMTFLTYIPKRSGDLRESYFIEKRKRQPSIDERNQDQTFHRDPFEKLVVAK